MIPLLRRASRSALIRPGAISPRIAYTRTGLAVGLTPASLLYEVAANVPRFNAAGEAIWEGQRSNSNPNPRLQGASGATPPTGASLSLPSGLTPAWTYETRGGILGARLTITGTASSTQAVTLNLCGSTDVASANGQTWASSVYVQVITDQAAFSSLRLFCTEGTAGGGFLAATTLDFYSSRLDLTRQSVTRTNNNASTGTQRITIDTSTITSGTVVNWAMWLSLPQLEQGAFVSTPALPPTTGASTRGADTGAFSLLAGTGPGSIVMAARPGQAAPSGAAQVYVSINNGADTDRIELINLAGGNDMRLTRVVTSTGTNTSTLGSQVPGSALVGVVSWDGAGNAAAKIRGGTYRTIGSITTGMTGGRIANRISGAGALFGTVAWMDELPGRYLTEAQMDVEIAKLGAFV